MSVCIDPIMNNAHIHQDFTDSLSHLSCLIFSCILECFFCVCVNLRERYKMGVESNDGTKCVQEWYITCANVTSNSIMRRKKHFCWKTQSATSWIKNHATDVLEGIIIFIYIFSDWTLNVFLRNSTEWKRVFILEVIENVLNINWGKIGHLQKFSAKQVR